MTRGNKILLSLTYHDWNNNDDDDDDDDDK